MEFCVSFLLPGGNTMSIVQNTFRMNNRKSFFPSFHSIAFLVPQRTQYSLSSHSLQDRVQSVMCKLNNIEIARKRESFEWEIREGKSIDLHSDVKCICNKRASMTRCIAIEPVDILTFFVYHLISRCCETWFFFFFMLASTQSTIYIYCVLKSINNFTFSQALWSKIFYSS